MSAPASQPFNGLVFDASNDTSACSFVLDILQVREIVQPHKAKRLPGSNAHYPGIIMLREEALLVVDVAALCGLTSSGDEALLMVVDTAAGQRAALRIQQFHDIESFDGGALQHKHVGQGAPWLKGLLRSQEGKLCMVLDPSLLVSATAVDLTERALQCDELVAVAAHIVDSTELPTPETVAN